VFKILKVMKLQLFQADAFASNLFKGNPAAVVPLAQWLPDQTMQQIAAENNLSETAFFIPEEDHFHIRWFTPKTEVNLCGHATLATAHVHFNELNFKGNTLHFNSKSGMLMVRKTGNKLQLDFPVDLVKPIEMNPVFAEALGREPIASFKGCTKHFFLFESEEMIRTMKPNFHLLKQTDARGVIVTAAGREVDFVSRFFAPVVGIDEDPVTGSAHTSLVPFWAEKLQKTRFTALQLSERGGQLWCELAGDRVLIAGNAVTYLRGEIEI
jgi:PhzF family phenazine biosynthesis protein